MKNLSDKPLMKVSREPCGNDRYGKGTFYHRIAIAQTAQHVNYRVLLIPFRMGEPLPQISGSTLAWKEQTDTLDFTRGADNRTRCVVTRK